MNRERQENESVSTGHRPDNAYANETRLLQALEIGQVGSWECAFADGRVLLSPSFQKMHGISDESPTTFEALLSRIHSADRQLFEKELSKAWESCGEYRIQYRTLWPDGSEHWLEGHGKTFLDELGKAELLVGICTDITGRRQTEELLDRRAREQTALYELIDRMRTAESLEEIYSSALDCIVTALNCHRASLLLFDEMDVMRFVAWRGLSDGYRQSAEGHSPWTRDDKDPLPITMPDARVADLSVSLQTVILGEGIRALSFIPLLCDGSLIGKFMVYFDAPHEFTNDEIDLALTIGRQLAAGIEHKRAEEDLFGSEERLRLALEAGRMGTWDWKVGAERLSWSPSLEAIYGYKPGMFPGTFAAYQSCIHPEDRQNSLNKVNDSLANKNEHEVQHRVVWPDGSLHWVEGRGKVIRDSSGKPIRMVGVATDISKRKKIEEDIRFLADASASLASLSEDTVTLQKLATLAVPTFADWCAADMIEPDGTLKRVAVAHIDPAKVQLAKDLHNKYPPDPDRAQGAWEIVRSGKSEIISEITDEFLEASIPDPELVKIVRDLGLRSYIGVPLTVRGKVLGVISFVAAESGRRYDSEDLATAEDLAYRTAVAIQNARLYQELREADQRKDTFLATLAHELRNPLAPMRYALQIMSKAEGKPDIQQDARDTINRQLIHMVRLVDDLLDVSRITQDKLQLQQERVDLISILNQAIADVRPSLAESRHQIELQMPSEPIYLHADPTRLIQVFSNLLNNSAKFTNAEGRISLEVATAGDSAAIKVRDNGIGIAPEMLPHIFDMFAQANHAFSRTQSGLGIGLTLVKRLVELHGGTVSVHSDGLGKGSEFNVHLPILPRTPAHETSPSAPQMEAIGESLRILVVDDNRDAAYMLGKMLELSGHHTRIAFDGFDALEAAEAFSPQVAFMDIGLPELDGYQVAKKIREQPWGKSIYLVAITGWGQIEDRMKSAQAGFDMHLVKPVDFETLRNLLVSDIQLKVLC